MVAALVAGFLLLVSGCERRPSNAELDRWLRQARAADDAERARFGNGDESATWTLTITGRVPHPVVLPFREVDRLATTEYSARPSVESDHPELARFRGARLSDLLARGGAPHDLGEVTVVANDGFRATFSASDVQRFPVMLSVTWDGTPIARSRGGPLFTTLPNEAHPEIAETYSYSWWVFYATHLVADTEPATLRVGERTFDAAALAALPQAEVRVRHGFRVGWPAGELRMTGPRVRDVLAAAGVTLGAQDRVRVRVMAPVPDAADHAVRLDAARIAGSDLLLGLRMGDESAPIPGRLGGPIVLVFPPGVDAPSSESEWPTYVRALEVEPGGGAP